jgi:hypothetical protein
LKKVAARFPVKVNYWLFSGLIGLHVFVAAITSYELNFDWLLIFPLLLISLSLRYSLTQFNHLCIAPDDLCWTGENWLINDPHELNPSLYLELSDKSLITSSFCVLKFQHKSREFVWLFSRWSIGERTYRQLCRLINAELKLIQASDSKPAP